MGFQIEASLFQVLRVDALEEKQAGTGGSWLLVPNPLHFSSLYFRFILPVLLRPVCYPNT